MSGYEYRARTAAGYGWFGVLPDRASQYMASGYEVQRRRRVGEWEPVENAEEER